MEVPAKNIIDTVDLVKEDCFLPIYECIVNSIISLMKVNYEDKKIEIRVIREDGSIPNSLFDRTSLPIKDVIIEDNGEGFNSANFKSFS